MDELLLRLKRNAERENWENPISIQQYLTYLQRVSSHPISPPKLSIEDRYFLIEFGRGINDLRYLNKAWDGEMTESLLKTGFSEEKIRYLLEEYRIHFDSFIGDIWMINDEQAVVLGLCTVKHNKAMWGFYVENHEDQGRKLIRDYDLFPVFYSGDRTEYKRLDGNHHRAFYTKTFGYTPRVPQSPLEPAHPGAPTTNEMLEFINRIDAEIRNNTQNRHKSI